MENTEMKKRLFALLGAVAPAAVFAEGAAAPEGVSDAVTQLQGAATATIGAVRPAVVAVVVALFSLVAVRFAWKWIRGIIGR